MSISLSPGVSNLGPAGDRTVEGPIPIDVTATDNLGVTRAAVLANVSAESLIEGG